MGSISLPIPSPPRFHTHSQADVFLPETEKVQESATCRMEEIKDAEGRGSTPSSPHSPLSFFRRSRVEDLKMTSASNSPNEQAGVGSIRPQPTLSVDSLDPLKDFNIHKGHIDTASPFESVKEAVSKFGGILDWKAHKVIALEKSKCIQSQLEKMHDEIPNYKRRSEAAEDAKIQVLDELGRSKRLIEELRHTLEKTETEEAQAKQDSELAQLRAREMEQGISDDASVAAKTQVEVSKARHEAAVKELQSVKNEIAVLEEDYIRLVTERDLAIARSVEAVSAAKNIEKQVEDFTIELITIKEALESAHASHLEAEENRIGVALAKDQETLNWDEELKRAERDMQHLNNQLFAANDLKSELDTTSTVLFNLKSELVAHMEGKPIRDSEISDIQTSTRMARSRIEKTSDEVNCLRVAALSLKYELDRETEELTTLRRKDELTAVSVSSLEAEINRLQSELERVVTKEKEASEKIEELPKLIQQATRDAEHAKSVARLASEELIKAKEEVEEANSCVSAAEVKLHAALQEIEATEASGNFAIGTIKVMQEESEEKEFTFDVPPSSNSVTLPMEEYQILSKNAREAEELSGRRVISAIEQIKDAKKSELLKLERLEAAQKEREEKKRKLRMVMEKAEQAIEEKMGIEEEMRDWRAENEQRRRVPDDANQISDYPLRSSSGHFEENGQRKDIVHHVSSKSDPVNYDELVPELKTRRKKPFFPRVVMFLARKKVYTVT